MAKKIKDLDCILLVDDDGPTNFIHRKVIQASEIDTHVQTTTSGVEALEYLTCSGRYSNNATAPQPGIIFLDINMPGMNGWEFLEDYRNLDEHQKARILVVMLTSSINPQDQEKADKIKEITTFLVKPLTLEAIEGLVVEHFGE